MGSLAIAMRDRRDEYPLYHAARGELELRCRHAATARRHFGTGLALARNQEGRRFLEKRVAACI
jgi:predicted RNA polymerase sigma factor